MKSEAVNAPPVLALGVVILAAGASRRMGRPKLLLAWGGTSVVGHLVSSWAALGARQVGVVMTAGDSALERELDRCGFEGGRIVNADPGAEMFSSIQCAARWSGWQAGLSHWAAVLGDQPQVMLDTLRRLLEFTGANPNRICQPARHGKARHPVLLPAHVFRQLREASEATLREFLLAHEADRRLCEIDDPGLDLDIDRPEDYARALRAGITQGQAFGSRRRCE